MSDMSIDRDSPIQDGACKTCYVQPLMLDDILYGPGGTNTTRFYGVTPSPRVIKFSFRLLITATEKKQASTKS